MTTIELTNLKKTYQNSLVFENINLTVLKGEAIAIIGKSGAGKSTLLNIIAGLERASSGNCIVKDNDYTNLNMKQRSEIRRQHIGYISQHSPIISKLTVLENILVPVYFQKIKSKTEIQRRIQTLGAMLEVDHLFSKNIETLSGGEIQRIGIIRAIITDPTIIVADEPTASLDEETTRLVLNCFMELKAKGISIVLATHHAHVYERCDRTYRLTSSGLHQ